MGKEMEENTASRKDDTEKMKKQNTKNKYTPLKVFNSIK